MDVLFINDREVQTLGLYPTVLERWGAGIEYAFESMPVPGRLGHLPAGTMSASPRVIRLTGDIDAATVAERDAKLAAVLAPLRGLLEIRAGDAPDKVLEGYLVGELSDGVVPTKSFVDGSAGLSLTLHLWCPSPVKRDRFAQTIAFGAAATPVPLGDLPSGGLVRILGAATNPVLRYRDARGQLVQEMAFTTTLTSAQYLEIDLDRQTAVKVSAGVRTNAQALWTGDYPVPDPGDGDPTGAAWPTLEVTAGSGLYHHARRYRS